MTSGTPRRLRRLVGASASRATLLSASGAALVVGLSVSAGAAAPTPTTLAVAGVVANREPKAKANAKADAKADAGAAADASLTGVRTDPHGALARSPMVAPAELPPIALGMKLGVDVPTSRLRSSLLAAIDVSYRLPAPVDAFAAAVELAYSEPAQSGSARDPTVGSYSYELRARTLTLVADSVYRHAFWALDAYGGAGVSLSLVRTRLEAFDAEQEEMQLLPGMRLRAGCDYGAAHGRLFAEASFAYFNLHTRASGAVAGGGFAITAGYRFAL